jgi:hypothetical protein
MLVDDLDGVQVAAVSIVAATAIATVLVDDIGGVHIAALTRVAITTAIVTVEPSAVAAAIGGPRWAWHGNTIVVPPTLANTLGRYGTCHKQTVDEIWHCCDRGPFERSNGERGILFGGLL